MRGSSRRSVLLRALFDSCALRQAQCLLACCFEHPRTHRRWFKSIHCVFKSSWIVETIGIAVILHFFETSICEQIQHDRSSFSRSKTSIISVSAKIISCYRCSYSTWDLPVHMNWLVNNLQWSEENIVWMFILEENLVNMVLLIWCSFESVF